MSFKRLALNLFLFCISTTYLIAQDPGGGTPNAIMLPKQKPGVNDLERILDTTYVPLINRKIADLYSKYTIEIVVVTVREYGAAGDIAALTKIIADAWGIGTAHNDRAAIILISKNKRQVRISAGKGIDKVLTEIECRQITGRHMTPRFREGKYSKGILDGLDAIGLLLEQKKGQY
jgi:uncharacterized protein